MNIEAGLGYAYLLPVFANHTTTFDNEIGVWQAIGDSGKNSVNWHDANYNFDDMWDDSDDDYNLFIDNASPYKKPYHIRSHMIITED